MFKARDFRMIARDKLRGRWLISALVSFIASLLGATSSASAGFAGGFAGSQASLSTQDVLDPDSPAGLMEDFAMALEPVTESPLFWGILLSVLGIAFLIGLVFFVLGSAVSLGQLCYYTGLCKNENVSVETLFCRFRIILRAVGLQLFMGLFIFLWSLLLYIPGVIASYRYAMAPYILAQHPEMGIREAVNRSKDMMRGRKWRFFCLHLSFIGWVLLGALTFGIGYLFLNPYMFAADAAFYLDASGQGIPKNPQPEPAV